MDKIEKYFPVVLIGIVIFILWRMNKVMNMQTSLLIGMAGKLGVLPQENKVRSQKSQENTEHQEPENNDDEIVRIAEKIYNGKNLNKKDKEFYEKFEKDINEETGFFLQDDLKRIAEDIKSEKELTQDDIDLYKGSLKKFQKELDLPELPSEVKVKEVIKKEMNVPPTSEGKEKLIMSFFEDGIPKTLSILAELYANECGLVPSTGNTSKIVYKLEEDEKLKSKKILHQSRNKIFYGLPFWFDNKKFKKEYLQKIK